jgi:hypothetical protein
MNSSWSVVYNLHLYYQTMTTVRIMLHKCTGTPVPTCLLNIFHMCLVKAWATRGTNCFICEGIVPKNVLMICWPFFCRF